MCFGYSEVGWKQSRYSKGRSVDMVNDICNLGKAHLITIRHTIDETMMTNEWTSLGMLY